MDTANGLFYYINHNEMFSASTSSQVHVLSANDAITIANEFLGTTGLMPNDAQFTKVVAEIIVALSKETGQMRSQTVTEYQVTYSRILPYTTMVKQGDVMVQQVNEMPVVGPGAKLKVYVNATGGSQARVASAANPLGSVVAVQGGWRDAGGGQVATAAQPTVPILSYNQIEQLFMQLEPQVALAHVPFENLTHKEILQYALPAWEEPGGTGQDQLYPTYLLQARYEGVVELGDGITETEVVTGDTYIPANETFMRPLAMIESTSDLSHNLLPGQVVTFTAADASLTLAELGYHESLTFTMGSGGSPRPHAYEWYLGSVADENLIGSGRNLSYVVGLAGEDWHSVPVPQTVILVVKDMNSPHTSQNSNNTSVQFNVIPPLFLPLVLRSS